LALNNWLQKLELHDCKIRNDGLANLLMSMGEINNRSLTYLGLIYNHIHGAKGGLQVSLLLQRFQQIKFLVLALNNLGPLGARELAPGLAAASHLESLRICHCSLGNDGIMNLIPNGHVNRSLAMLDLCSNNIRGVLGGENVVALAARCTNLDSISINMRANRDILSPDQRRRLNLILNRKRQCTTAQALAGSTFSVLFPAVEEAHGHEYGLSAIFVILQNDGDDYFCNANNRAIE
jgi:hypothetical protein